MERSRGIESKVIPDVTFYFLKLDPWLQSQIPLEKINIQQESAIKASAVPETSLESLQHQIQTQPNPLTDTQTSISAFIPIQKKINISQIYWDKDYGKLEFILISQGL